MVSKDQKREYLALVAGVEAILFRHDPVGINFETNSDEYNPEAVRIVAGLRKVITTERVAGLIHSVFVQMFGETSAGEQGRYTRIAEEIQVLAIASTLRGRNFVIVEQAG